MMEEERMLKLLKTNTAYGIELAIDQYGASVKTICQSILSGYSTQDIEETAVSNAEYQTLYELIDDMKSPDQEALSQLEKKRIYQMTMKKIGEEKASIKKQRFKTGVTKAAKNNVHRQW